MLRVPYRLLRDELGDAAGGGARRLRWRQRPTSCRASLCARASSARRRRASRRRDRRRANRRVTLSLPLLAGRDPTAPSTRRCWRCERCPCFQAGGGKRLASAAASACLAIPGRTGDGDMGQRLGDLSSAATSGLGRERGAAWHRNGDRPRARVRLARHGRIAQHLLLARLSSASLRSIASAQSPVAMATLRP